MVYTNRFVSEVDVGIVCLGTPGTLIVPQHPDGGGGV